MILRYVLSREKRLYLNLNNSIKITPSRLAGFGCQLAQELVGGQYAHTLGNENHNLYVNRARYRFR